MPAPTTTPEHRWLARLVGDWTWSHEGMPGEPGADHVHGEATENWRLLGEVWAVGEGNGDYGPMLFTLGYDPDRACVVGSFVTSALTFFWLYEGQLDGPDKLVLRTRGPNMGEGGGLANFRDEFEFLGPDERVLRSFVEATDGTWSQFMQARYRRRA